MDCKMLMGTIFCEEELKFRDWIWCIIIRIIGKQSIAICRQCSKEDIPLIILFISKFTVAYWCGGRAKCIRSLWYHSSTASYSISLLNIIETEQWKNSNTNFCRVRLCQILWWCSQIKKKYTIRTHHCHGCENSLSASTFGNSFEENLDSNRWRGRWWQLLRWWLLRQSIKCRPAIRSHQGKV